MVNCKKTIFGGWNKFSGKIVSKGLDKDKNEIRCLEMPELTRGTPVSVRFSDKNAPNGFHYVAAWILAQMPTKDTEMSNFKITFGKNSKRERMVVPMTSIHAPCLVGKHYFM